jgi:hypothetical protein
MSEKPEEKSREIIDQLLAAAGIRSAIGAAGSLGMASLSYAPSVNWSAYER